MWPSSGLHVCDQGAVRCIVAAGPRGVALVCSQQDCIMSAVQAGTVLTASVAKRNDGLSGQDGPNKDG